LVESMLLIFLVFCVVVLCIFTFWVLCCDVCYNFFLITMFVFTQRRRDALHMTRT
jgi:hypothetical protein